jgi:iduronate 2-sulfatase
MKRIFVLLTVFLIVTACNNAKKNEQKQDIPKTDKNVLFIVIDDLNNTLGTYGHPIVKTPNIDNLAGMGVQYNNAYCNFAVCGPSRSSFLTGLRPETINVIDNNTPLQPLLGDKVTLPYLFKQNGFETIGLGKIFHRMGEYDDPKAWDAYYNFETTKLGKQGEKRNLTDGELKWCWWQAREGTDDDQEDGQIAKKAVEIIKTKRDKPFFLAVGLKKPHDPFVAPKKYFDMYPLEACDPPLLPEGWEPPYSHTLPNETSIFNNFSDQDKREFLRSYYACTSFMDAQVGRLLDALKTSGQLENTLVVFFGDHGYHLGEHNWWNKVTVFEKGTNAPFIMAGNSVGKKGVKSTTMFEFIDIYPTLAELMDLKNVPEYLEGQSFAASVDDPEKPFKTEVKAVTRRGDMLGRMVKKKDWRYVEWDFGKKGKELYNQQNDPLEYNNLAKDASHKDVVDEMKALLYKKD